MYRKIDIHIFKLSMLTSKKHAFKYFYLKHINENIF